MIMYETVWVMASIAVEILSVYGDKCGSEVKKNNHLGYGGYHWTPVFVDDVRIKTALW